jgi:hypothetical protein
MKKGMIAAMQNNVQLWAIVAKRLSRMTDSTSLLATETESIDE